MSTEPSSEVDTFSERLKESPKAFFSYVLDSVIIANQARYEMQGFFVYPEGRDIGKFFRALTEFISASANVSRVFWDTSGKNDRERVLAAARTRILRDLLGLDEKHPLAQRQWRNHLAHYETRIDDWLVTSKNRNIARRIVGPIGRTIGGLDEREIFEQYDPGSDIFYFRGEKFIIGEIHSDINAVARLIAERGFAK